MPIMVPITNYGHVPVIKPTFVFTHVRNKAVANRLINIATKTWTDTLNENQVIEPGAPPFQLAIQPPNLAVKDQIAVETGQESEFISVVGTYSPGFGLPPNYFNVSVTYAPLKKSWVEVEHGLHVVDLNKEQLPQ